MNKNIYWNVLQSHRQKFLFIRERPPSMQIAESEMVSAMSIMFMPGRTCYFPPVIFVEKSHDDHFHISSLYHTISKEIILINPYSKS